MSANDTKYKSYPLLRAVSVAYSILAAIAVFLSLGATGALLVDIFYGNHPDRQTWYFSIVSILMPIGLIVGGFLLGLTFAVIGQILRLLLDINANMHHLTENTYQTARSIRHFVVRSKVRRRPSVDQQIAQRRANLPPNS